MRFGVGFIPFIDYDTTPGLLGLRVAGEWTREELCLLPYDCEAFNAYMCTRVKSVRALIRMDWCSAAGDLVQNSHVIAAHYSPLYNGWMLQDNEGGWYPTLDYDDKEVKENPVLLQSLCYTF